MPAGDAYRDELSAAQARIELLERQLSEERASSQHAATLAALIRERARAVGATEPPRIWPKLILVFVVFWLTGAAFLFDGDWFFGTAALLAPFLMGAVGQKILDANAAANSRQLALVDQRIAEIERATKQPLRDTA
jgi:hypothetical protein